MKKIWAIAAFAFCASSFAWENEYGVIPTMFGVDAAGQLGFYRHVFSDGDKGDLSGDAETTNVDFVPTIRLRLVRGLEFNFSYPFRDDEFKDEAGFWGPILGIKYGGPSSAGFFEFVFPEGDKELLGNGQNPDPALIFGGTNFFGGMDGLGVRLHTWYFWDFNDGSADEWYFLLRPEYSFSGIRIGLGFPFELFFGNSDLWISNTPSHVRARGFDEDATYAMTISIEPSVLIPLGMVDLEPKISFPLWKYTDGNTTFLYYGYSIGLEAHFKFGR